MLLSLGGCGSTAVQVGHPVIAGKSDPQTAKVYFMRRDHGFMGVADIALSISAGGQELLTLAKGQYTLLHLRPIDVEFSVASYTVALVAGKGTMTNVTSTRRFSFAAGETYYLLFAPVPRGFTEGDEFPPRALSKSLAVEAAKGLAPVGLAVADPIGN